MNQGLAEKVAQLTREKIAPRAATYDRTGKNPLDSWRDLAAEGVLAGAVPQAYGGLGLDMPTYTGIIRTIARGCASTAMTLHMHSTVMRFIDALATDGQKRRWYPEVVRHGKLFGSWGSEPAVSLSRALAMETAIKRGSDGWVIDGVKHFCTMALGASYYMVWCAIDGGTDMSTALLPAVVPADAAGMSTDGNWDTLGMRATYSPAVTFTGVHVAPDAGLGEPGAAIRVGVIEGFALGYAAIYLGIAESALDFAVDYVKKRIVRPENVSVATDPSVQRHVGELAARLHATSLVVEDAARQWEPTDVPGRGLLANRAKWLATETALEVTSRAIQVVGGRGAYRDFPLERALRDVRTSTLMPPTVDRMLEAIGKSALGIQTAMFRVGG